MAPFMVRTPEVGSVGEGVMRALLACWMYTTLIWGAAVGPGAGAAAGLMSAAWRSHTVRAELA